MPKKINRSLMSTAYHESGHAIVSAYLDLEFDYFTIEPDGDSLRHFCFRRKINSNASFERKTNYLIMTVIEVPYIYKPR